MTKKLDLSILLLIVDNPSIRYWLKKQLANQFYIIESTKKNRALEIVNSSALDLIIIDANFEDADSLQICKELRRNSSAITTPILLITDRLKKSYLTEAAKSGVSDFLFQPLDAEELNKKIETNQKTNQSQAKVSDLFPKIKAQKSKASPDYFKNKFILNEEGLQLLASAKKKNATVTVIFAQIDRFFEIHSKLKSASSKDLLANFLNFLKQQFEDKDLIIPHTNGQFIILLPEETIEKSQETIETLRKKIKQKRFLTKQGPIHLSASFVLSKIDSTEKSLDHMLDAAVKSLHQSFNLNNQIFLMNEDEP